MTAADKLRELLATRPAMPNTEELVRWWRTSAELLPVVLDELAGLQIEVDAHNDASTPAFDEIAKLCGCPTWGYPGQVIRDVQGVVAERDKLRAEAERLGGLVEINKDLEIRRVRMLDDQEVKLRALDVEIAEAKEYIATLGVAVRKVADAPIEAREVSRVSEEVFERGYWHSCSGCHESNEGHPTGPYNATFRCHVGGGCHECGGIGAVWEQVDERQLAGPAPITIAGPPAWPAGKLVDVNAEAKLAGRVTAKANGRAVTIAVRKDESLADIAERLAAAFEQAAPADDETRCAVCGWPLRETQTQGCVRGNCSHRPRPSNLYASERAKKEAEDLHERALRNGMPPSGRWA